MKAEGSTSDLPQRAPLAASDVAPLLEAADHFEIEVDEEQVALRGAFWGRVRGCKLALGVRFLGGQPAGYAHFAEADDPVLGPITVEPWTGQARGRQLTGDEEADQALSVHGDPAMVRAWLDDKTRRRVIALFEPLPRPMSLTLGRRRVTFRGPETMAVDGLRMIADAEGLLTLVEAARLSRRPQLERVVHNALEDPVPAVREINAAVLGELMPRAGEDARYGAAVRLLFADQVAIDRRLDVLRIVRALPAERVAPLMHRVLDEGPIELARRAVGWAKDTARPDSVRHLAKVIRRFDDARMHRTVVEVLASIGDPRAQPVLLNLLAREDDPLRVEVMRALAELGNAEAVPEIMPFTKGLFTDRDLKREARDAVRAIEARCTGVFEIPPDDD